jgi:orotate phosphoribosyltransferase
MSYKTEFIKFMYECGVLRFGEFTLKSGRIAPYFINTGLYCKGSQIARLGEFYADCIKNAGVEFDTLFGPAYKGIPLAVAAANALYNKYNIDKYYCFDRKEAKDHGEGGVIVGKKLEDGERVLIVEDVITAGTAVRETVPVLKNAADVAVAGMIISVDRMEKGKGETSAVMEVEAEFGFKVYPIVTIIDIIAATQANEIPCAEFLPKMKAYREQYGVK